MSDTPDLLTFDLAKEAADLRASPAWSASGHAARTLVRTDDARVVLITIRAGGSLDEHRTDHAITVHVLDGYVQVNAAGQTSDLLAQGLLFVAAGIPHDVVAREDSTVLLTISWPGVPSGR